MKRRRKKEGKIRIDVVVLVILLIIFIILLAVYIERKINPLFLNSSSSSSIPTPSINKTPPPTGFPLPEGKQVFSVTYGDKDPSKPRLTSIAIDPLSPTLGTKQVLILSAKSNSPITQFAATLMTDTKTVTFYPKLVRGTAMDGDWEAGWISNDTVGKRYYITFRMVSKLGTRDDDIAFR